MPAVSGKLNDLNRRYLYQTALKEDRAALSLIDILNIRDGIMEIVENPDDKKERKGVPSRVEENGDPHLKLNGGTMNILV